MYLSLNKLREIAKDRKAWCAAVRGVTKSRTSHFLLANEQPKGKELESLGSPGDELQEVGGENLRARPAK